MRGKKERVNSRLDPFKRLFLRTEKKNKSQELPPFGKTAGKDGDVPIHLKKCFNSTEMSHGIFSSSDKVVSDLDIHATFLSLFFFGIAEIFRTRKLVIETNYF